MENDISNLKRISQDLDWDSLRHFHALAQTLNLAAAGKRLHASQSTVLRRVRELESQLNTALFVRNQQGHALTTSGQALVPLASEVDELIQQATHRVAGEHTSTSGRVQIATTEFGADHVLTGQLAAFCAEYPGIELSITISPLPEKLLQSEPAIALRFSRPDAGDYVIRKLGVVAYSLYAQQALAKRLYLADGQMAGRNTPFIGWTASFAHISIARWLAQSFDAQAQVVALSSMRGHLLAAQTGVGVALLPCAVADACAGLVPVHSLKPPVSLGAWLLVPTQYKRTARVAVVATFVEKAFHALIAPT